LSARVEGFDFDGYLASRRSWVEEALERLCSSRPERVPSRLWSAMVYSLTAGGKRLRPVLCLMAAEAFGLEGQRVMPLALAFEMIHTASLIHDDLPCMDDDDLRRGKPTNHVVFGEAMALLAGDALLALAFESAIEGLMANHFSGELISLAVMSLAKATGPSGICGGQSMDMGFEDMGQLGPDRRVMEVARSKTGVLIASSLEGGAIMAGADEDALSNVRGYGMALGKAFQVADDILDVTGKVEEIGKSVGKDQAQGKVTFVAVHGLQGAREILEETSGEAKEWAAKLPRPDMFCAMVDKLMRRTS